MGSNLPRVALLLPDPIVVSSLKLLSRFQGRVFLSESINSVAISEIVRFRNVGKRRFPRPGNRIFRKSGGCNGFADKGLLAVSKHANVFSSISVKSIVCAARRGSLRKLAIAAEQNCGLKSPEPFRKIGGLVVRR